MINQNEDYDDYRTPGTGKIDETSFLEPDTIEEISALQNRFIIQVLRRDRRSRPCRLRSIYDQEKFKNR